MRETFPVHTTTATAVAMAVWGFFSCFFGYRFYRIVVALFGAVVGGALLFVGAAALFPVQPGVALVGLVVGAVLGGLLAWFAVAVVFFLWGVLAGVALALATEPFGTPAANVLTGLVGGAALGALLVWLRRPMIMLTTAWSGAVAVALATAFFVSGLEPLDYLEAPVSFSVESKTAKPAPARPRKSLLDQPWVLAHAAVLGGIGFLVQRRWGEKPEKPGGKKGKK